MSKKIKLLTELVNKVMVDRVSNVIDVWSGFYH